MTRKSRPKREPHLTQDQFVGLQRLSSSSAEHIIGIDEVGMGSWAGPVVVAGVCVRREWDHPSVRDSKRLTHKTRQKALYEQIYPNALAYVVLSKSSAEIDRIGIKTAHAQLMEGVGLYLRHRFPKALVVMDGDEKFAIPDGQELNNGYRGVIAFKKADDQVPCVRAASILAKVSRDLFMKAEAEKHPGYGFETNVGYHSHVHKQALDRWGITPLHRKSYKPVAMYC
jgi:ribonuclease HII